MSNENIIMGIKNPLVMIYLVFVGFSILSSLNIISITTVTAEVDGSGYTARGIFRWRTKQPIVSATTILSIWNPSVVRPSDYSVGKIAVVFVNKENKTTASMEAGYIVSPGRYGDNFTRAYIKWKNIAANGTVTGCFDLDCPGFKPVNARRGFIGGRLGPSRVGSRPAGASTFQLSIRQYRPRGNWVLSRDRVVIGEWPDSLFTAKGSNRFNAAEIGGEVYDSTGDTAPRSQMGDGQLPDAISNKGAFFYQTYVSDADQTLYSVPSPAIQQIFTNPTCYGADFANSVMFLSREPVLFYGGPGCST